MNDLKFTTCGDYLADQQVTKRIGFACKYLHYKQNQPKKLLEELQRPLTERSTTVAWLNRQSKDVAEERMWDIMVHNAAAAKRLVEYVGSLPPILNKFPIKCVYRIRPRLAIGFHKIPATVLVNIWRYQKASAKLGFYYLHSYRFA